MFYYLNSNIRYLRKKAGYTIPKFAELLDLKKSTIDNIECGNRNTSIEVLDKIRKLFNLSLDDLVYTDLSQKWFRNGSMYFKENLIFLMKIKNLSAPMLSELSGVPKTTINSIKSPSSKYPTLDTAYKLAVALNISLDEMISKDLSKK